MSRFVPILILALAFVGCDADRQRDGAPGSSEGELVTTASSDASGEVTSGEVTPTGLPSPVDTFGAAVVDVDRVVLTERTPLPSDGPAPTDAASGRDAHPNVWETTDPEWIEAFIASVGRDTRRVERGNDERAEEDCRPWADLTLYRDQTAAASFAVECPRGSFHTFRTRPPTHVFVAKDETDMSSLLQNLRASEPPRGPN